MLQRILLIGLAVLVVGGAFYYFSSGSQVKAAELISKQVSKGDFLITVTATGELKAKRSEKIRGPQGMRSARIYQTTITDMVPEGTVVKEGEYVARLDKTELDQKVKEAQTEIEKILTQLEQAEIDTAIELRGLRDQLINLNFSMKEKKLEVEKSRYEPQMVIRQAELDLEKIQRDYNQLEKKYELTQEKSQAKISEINTQLRQNQIKLNQLVELAEGFVIKAPKNGMVIYKNSWNGKVGPGSQISTWDPVVAELPDLSDMVSKTYVNEVDISRVKKGQDVKIKVDAFPENDYTGTVIKVANIGEQLKGFDAKVFEVLVQVAESDSILRPAMTTSNEIITDIIPEMLSIPLEALQTDSLKFVFKKEGNRIVKREVVTGLTNTDEVIVEYGLDESDFVLLNVPENAKELEFQYLEKSIKDEILKKQEEEKLARQARMQEKMKKVKDENISSDEESGGSFIIFN